MTPQSMTDRWADEKRAAGRTAARFLRPASQEHASYIFAGACLVPGVSSIWLEGLREALGIAE